jgi:hypothetical protein
MIFYFSALLWAYLLVAYCRKIPLFASFIVAIPLVVFSTFRGQSGKDTPLYLLRFFNADYFGSGFGLDSEPILNIIALLAHFIEKNNHYIFFFIHSALVLTLFIFICRKFSNARYYLYTVGPVFLIDGLTNGMRITLAYHFILMGYFYRGKSFYFLLAFLSHLTSVLPIFLSYLFVRRGFYLFLFFGALATVFLYFVDINWLISTFAPRVVSKATSYSELVLGSAYSGLADIFIIYVLLVFMSFFNRKRLFLLVIDVVAALLVCFVLYQLIQVSLAFIRVLKLIIIALISSPFLINSRKHIPSWALVLPGLAYSGNFIRQVFVDEGFLPYGE